VAIAASFEVGGAVVGSIRAMPSAPPRTRVSASIASATIKQVVTDLSRPDGGER
jgi:hypothetical protein